MRIKRTIVSTVAALIFFTGILPLFPGSKEHKESRESKGGYLNSALKAAKWVTASAVKTPRGVIWPVEPGKPDTLDSIYTLYSGTPGVVLFFLELHYSTGREDYLDHACKGADQLLASVPVIREAGFYVGLSGIGFVLEGVFRASGKEKYRKGVRECVRLIRERAKTVGAGVEWEYRDIISGSAGTGLFLLYIADALKDPSIKDLAVKVGRRLVEVAVPEKGGFRWRLHPDYKRYMPNFSHGTAGIAYFLATLYKETKQKEFLDAALGGAKFLLSAAKSDGDTCMVFHHEPGGEELYYLGWCHGPVGTARLFYRLYEVTGDSVWLDWVKKGAAGILESGIPWKETPGFWNNVGRCCGAAGVAEFFLDLNRIVKDSRYIEYSKKVTAFILEKAKVEGKGVSWVQAEHRVKPEFLQAQTGLMQGASGIGLWLLKLDSFEKGKRERIIFPDSPF